MNANELADKLEIAQGNNNTEELIPEAIAMLRHQQAEIDSLKDKLMLAKQSLEIVEGWTKNEYEPPDFFFVEHDLMGKR